MANQNFPGKQAELYLAARIGWKNFLTYLIFFADFKALYTLAFQAAQLAQITTAQKIPDVNVRNAKISLKLLKTKETAKKVRNNFQSLKTYINSAFEEEEISIKYREAGIAHYRDAASENWDAVENLITDSTTFITQNQAALLAGDNMPPSFQLNYENAASDFTKALEAFYEEETIEKKATEDKIIASNKVHDELMKMFTDAQEIFRDDDALKSTFTYEYVYSLVTQKMANLTGNITTATPSESKKDFQIKILETDDTKISNEQGHFDFGAIAGGIYTVEVSKTSYITQTIPNVEIKVGTTEKRDIKMLQA
jgi:hypothetical protein